MSSPIHHNLVYPSPNAGAVDSARASQEAAEEGNTPRCTAEIDADRNLDASILAAQRLRQRQNEELKCFQTDRQQIVLRIWDYVANELTVRFHIPAIRVGMIQVDDLAPQGIIHLAFGPVIACPSNVLQEDIDRAFTLVAKSYCDLWKCQQEAERENEKCLPTIVEILQEYCNQEHFVSDAIKAWNRSIYSEARVRMRNQIANQQQKYAARQAAEVVA